MPLSARPQAHFDGALVGREMDGAVEQADQRLPKARAVGEQRTGKRFELEIEFDPFAGGFLRGVRGGVDELFRIDGRELQPEISRQQAPRVDDFVDEVELLLRLTDDRLARAHVAGLVQRLALDELRPSDDAVERAAQIVRDDAEVVVGKSVDLERRPLRGVFSPLWWVGCLFCFGRASSWNLFPSC